MKAGDPRPDPQKGNRLLHSPRPCPSTTGIRKLEAINQAVLERLDRSERERRETEARYRALERKYDALEERLGTARSETGSVSEHRPVATRGRARENSEGTGSNTGEAARGFTEATEGHEGPELPLRAFFGEGFGFRSLDDEYQLRLRVLDQTDFKVFVPDNQFPARAVFTSPACGSTSRASSRGSFSTRSRSSEASTASGTCSTAT